MRGHANPMKAECIRQRVEERLSLREIHERTGISKGSLSTWLAPYPLTEAEKAQKRQAAYARRAPRKTRGEESSFHKAVEDRELSRQDRARIAEAAVLFRLVVHGFHVFRSLSDGDKADWVVETPSGIVRKIQVKWASHTPHGLPHFKLTCTAEGHAGKKRYRRYRAGKFDFIVGYDLFSDTAYVFSDAELAGHKAAVTVRPDAAERWDKLV